MPAPDMSVEQFANLLLGEQGFSANPHDPQRQQAEKVAAAAFDYAMLQPFSRARGRHSEQKAIKGHQKAARKYIAEQMQVPSAAFGFPPLAVGFIWGIGMQVLVSLIAKAVWEIAKRLVYGDQTAIGRSAR